MTSGGCIKITRVPEKESPNSIYKVRRFVFVCASPAFGRFVFALLYPSSYAMYVLDFTAHDIGHITPLILLSDTYE